MKFGVGVSIQDWESASQVATLADEVGYDCFLISDHYMGASRNNTLDAWTLLSHIAAKTSRIKLGTVVTPIPFHQPSILAKIVATVDLISEGRVIFGVGAGWYKPEFEAYSVWDDNVTRVAKFKEGLKLIKRLWTEDCINFEGEYYRARGAILEPKPIQKPHPPIWFGTMGEYMLKLTAKYGDGWISNIGSKIRPSIEKSRECIDKLQRYRKAAKRKNKFSFAISGGIEDGSKRVEILEALGCNYYILSGIQVPPKSLESITCFAKEIIPSFK